MDHGSFAHPSRSKLKGPVSKLVDSWKGVIYRGYGEAEILSRSRIYTRTIPLVLNFVHIEAISMSPSRARFQTLFCVFGKNVSGSRSAIWRKPGWR